ncbi:PadR family transcriptional regulator [Nocardioides sp.]|uniref:PadR family transcriptional regulator n=1 Tax=Nocardioides sp. TaxID=35761 RepID=UPI00272C4B32|nr:PadR family transcriptional regulator [Nocardioides sp.]
MGGPGGSAGGPPPWVAGLFGMGQPERGRGPRVRRGDVRVAILDVLATAARSEEPVNGYQVIQQIAERSEGGWRPSPGSVYPTIQQLQDEGLVEADDERGRRSLRLTEAGQTYVDEHADEVAAVWAPFESGADADATKDGAKPGKAEHADLKTEIGQVMPAVWQIVTQGSELQRRAAIEILADTRRRLYGVLADGPEGTDGTDRGDEQ